MALLALRSLSFRQHDAAELQRRGGRGFVASRVTAHLQNRPEKRSRARLASYAAKGVVRERGQGIRCLRNRKAAGATVIGEEMLWPFSRYCCGSLSIFPHPQRAEANRRLSPKWHCSVRLWRGAGRKPAREVLLYVAEGARSGYAGIMRTERGPRAAARRFELPAVYPFFFSRFLSVNLFLV